MWLKVWGRENGIMRISSICSRFVKLVGFLNGCVELMLKKLLLLVLSSLMVFCEVIGLLGMVCVLFEMVVMLVKLVKFWIMLFVSRVMVLSSVIGRRMWLRLWIRLI